MIMFASHVNNALFVAFYKVTFLGGSYWALLFIWSHAQDNYPMLKAARSFVQSDEGHDIMLLGIYEKYMILAPVKIKL